VKTCRFTACAPTNWELDCRPDYETHAKEPADPLAQEACQAAYNFGPPWLGQLGEASEVAWGKDRRGH
jgi:hypothetical protein